MKCIIRYLPGLIFTAIAVLFLFSCDNDNVVGSDEGVIQINNVVFTVTDRTVSSNKLTATGTIKNNGSSKISPLWYIDGEFYADSTQKLILGGDVTSMNIPLNAGVETIWTLELSDPDIAEGNYPEFVVTNLRAYYRD